MDKGSSGVNWGSVRLMNVIVITHGPVKGHKGSLDVSTILCIPDVPVRVTKGPGSIQKVG
jgi:hypothetical protein